MNRLACYREPVAVARASTLLPTRRGAQFAAKAESAFEPGDESSIHTQELLGRPAAVLLQIFAGPGCPAHEVVRAAVQIARRAAAPPLAVVGHGTRRRSIEWPSSFDAYAPSTAK